MLCFWTWVTMRQACGRLHNPENKTDVSWISNNSLHKGKKYIYNQINTNFVSWSYFHLEKAKNI